MTISASLTNPTVGQQIRMHNQQYTIGLPAPDGHFPLANLAGGPPIFMTRQEIAQQYLDGYAEYVEEPVTATFRMQRKLHLLDLTLASDQEKTEVRRKQAYVDALEEFGVTTYQPSRFRQIIDVVTERLGDKRQPTHWTLQRWRRDWEKSQGDPRVFLPQHARRGNRRLRWPQELVQLAGQVAQQGFLTKQKHTVSMFFHALELAVLDTNQFRKPEHHIKMPSEGSVRRYCKRIDPFNVMASREGRRMAERTQRQFGRGVKTTRILERVEIDHTLLDLFVIDSKSEIILGRPWLTIVLDAHSRAILAFYLSFGPPSWVAVMEALKRAILPKTDLRKKYPEIQNSWDCHGYMETAVTDNGKEFLSTNFEDASQDQNIKIQFCPPQEPWYKGKVERFMRTINQGFVHTVPGSTFGKQYRLPDYDPVKHATVDFHDLVKLMHMWVVDVYMQDYHEGIKTTPAAKWAEEALKNPPRLPNSKRDLEIALGIVVQRCIHHYGIEISGQLFNCQELSLIRARLESPEKGKRRPMARVKIKLMPGDISGIYVRNPLTDEYLWVPNTDPEYAEGKGWHQHKIIQAYARSIGKGKVNPEDLRRAEGRIARQIKKSIKQGGSKRGNKEIARYERVAQQDYQNSADAQADHAAPHEVDFSLDQFDESVPSALAEVSIFHATPLPAAPEGWGVSTD